MATTDFNGLPPAGPLLPEDVVPIQRGVGVDSTKRTTVGDLVALGGSGAELPPPPSRNVVWGVDALGVPGWVPRREFVGATLWPTTDTNKGTTEPTFGYSNVIFGDAEEYGLPFFKYDGTATERERITIPKDGLYVVSFSVSFQSATGVNRARVFLNGDPIVLDLLGRVAAYFTGTGSVDTSGVSAPIRLRAGDYLKLGVLPAVDVMHAARSTWFSIERVG